MKTKLLTTLFLLATLGVMGQGKNPTQSTFYLDSATRIRTTAITNKDLVIAGNSSMYANSLNFIQAQSNTKPWLIIEAPTRDSVIMHFKKSQLRWINDSTAVITK